MRRACIALGALVVVGCTTDSEPGFADVMGHLMLASGLPLTSAIVTVSCGSGAPELVPGDSLGRYQIGLESTVGTHHCSFLVVDPGTPGFQVNAAVAFAPPPRAACASDCESPGPRHALAREIEARPISRATHRHCPMEVLSCLIRWV